MIHILDMYVTHFISAHQAQNWTRTKINFRHLNLRQEFLHLLTPHSVFLRTKFPSLKLSLCIGRIPAIWDGLWMGSAKVLDLSSHPREESLTQEWVLSFPTYICSSDSLSHALSSKDFSIYHQTSVLSHKSVSR